MLRTKNWRAANQETTTLVREIIDGQRESWLDQKSFQLLSTLILSRDSFYAEIKAIDNLWTKYSNNRFGFSIQEAIFLESGGKRFDIDQEFNSNKEIENQRKSFEKLGDRVGWRERAEWLGKGERQWITYNKLSFNDLSPRGHLPLLRIRFTGFLGAMNAISNAICDSSMFRIIGGGGANSEDIHLDVQFSASTSMWLGSLVSSTECG